MEREALDFEIVVITQLERWHARGRTELGPPARVLSERRAGYDGANGDGFAEDPRSTSVTLDADLSTTWPCGKAVATADSADIIIASRYVLAALPTPPRRDG